VGVLASLHPAVEVTERDKGGELASLARRGEFAGWLMHRSRLEAGLQAVEITERDKGSELASLARRGEFAGWQIYRSGPEAPAREETEA
jgi:hypothetical protein